MDYPALAKFRHKIDYAITNNISVPLHADEMVALRKDLEALEHQAKHHTPAAVAVKAETETKPKTLLKKNG